MFSTQIPTYRTFNTCNSQIVLLCKTVCKLEAETRPGSRRRLFQWWNMSPTGNKAHIHYAPQDTHWFAITGSLCEHAEPCSGVRGNWCNREQQCPSHRGAANERRDRRKLLNRYFVTGTPEKMIFCLSVHQRSANKTQEVSQIPSVLPLPHINKPYVITTNVLWDCTSV